MTSNQVKILLGVLTLAGVLGAALIGMSSHSDSDAAAGHFEANGDNNIQVNGSNNTINSTPKTRACRLPSHGVERYGRTFQDGESSGWMGGGHSQPEWCDNLKNKLLAQNPGADIAVLDHSESKRGTCPPFNCPQYNYYCKVEVKADPQYLSKVDDACP
jgi:hypothetical protein